MEQETRQIDPSPVHDIINGDEITLFSLDKLKIELRDDTFRESEIVTTNLSAIIHKFNKIIESGLQGSCEGLPLLGGVLPVLINLVARSDRNREFFTTDVLEVHEFWSLAQSLLVMKDDTLAWLAFTFLGQFIVESQKVGNFMRFFHSEGIHKSVYQRVDDEDDVGAFDVAYELIKYNAENLDEADTSLIEGIKNKLEDNFEAIKDREYVEKMVEVIAYSGPDKDAFDNLLRKLLQVEDANIARKMLVSASLMFTNKRNDIPFDQLKSHNPYVFAVCCIAIGNCIESDATRESTYDLVDARFGLKDNLVNAFFKEFKITDVIQIQAIHMWTNLMDVRLADKIITHYQSELIALNSIVLDNSQYYREISALYFKFLRKLLILTTKDIMLGLGKQISSLDSTVPDFKCVKYALLQKLNFDTDAGRKELLQLMKSVVTQLDHSDILEQIKTISIVNQNLTSDKIKLDPQEITQFYLQPLTELLKQMHAAEVSSTQDANSWQVKALRNNLKYVAATTTKVLDSISTGGSVTALVPLHQVCHQIITA
ncbi:hypothetical protein KGF57_004835 [Candida theae]|uniref:Uncharacterized protein n=1 Tax=Candida theae TaxID=1198502 RepID=A0AAD5BAH8_9ASCO|nr:uncharacterized protein KGF57_004835 [Candida theae]KAI5949237.1 hypothetical protein KGF57_004835 [Candida theae]